MSQYDDPADQRVSVAQLNLELRHAQLELLSAHCAIHQLRLHYSTDDLARFGQRDVLRKSADAANALSKFYASIEERCPQPTPRPPESFPKATDEQVAQAVEWLSSYLRAQCQHYQPSSRPLDPQPKSIMAPYFPAALLDRIRIVELEGARVAIPDFFAQVRVQGFNNLPDIPHMESLTFLDVVAFNEKLSERALFHALVHAVQIEVLGLERYAELWVRGFLKTHAHFTVPLEVHAFSMASRFLRPTLEKFSVEDEVLRWAADHRY
jgi:hypothetical protein